MIDYLEKAKKFYNMGIKELEESKLNGKQDLAVDGCAKIWLSVIYATNAFFKKKGIEKIPRTHRGRVYLLKKYGDREMRRTYDRAMGVIHIDGYYDAFIDYDRIYEVIDEISEYIKKIEDLI